MEKWKSFDTIDEAREFFNSIDDSTINYKALYKNVYPDMTFYTVHYYEKEVM